MKQLLILVHPGSLCGSADMNIGKFEARAGRDSICSELSAWQGSLLVLDGEFSDELPNYPQLDRAICGAVGAVVADDEFRVRLPADDPEHADIAVAFLQSKDVALNTSIGVTGAWYSPENTHGCVNAVFDALQGAGYTSVRVNDSAVSDSFEGCDVTPESEDTPSTELATDVIVALKSGLTATIRSRLAFDGFYAQVIAADEDDKGQKLLKMDVLFDDEVIASADAGYLAPSHGGHLAVLNIVVNESWRRLGIATALYDAVERHYGETVLPYPGNEGGGIQHFWLHRLKDFPDVLSRVRDNIGSVARPVDPLETLIT